MATIATPKSVSAPKKRIRGLTLTLSAISNAKVPIAAGCFYGALIALLVGALIPTFRSVNLGSYLSSPLIAGLLGAQINNLSSFTAFLGVELFSAIYGLLFGGILAYVAGAALPVNIENGTLDLALSRPISRIRYYLEICLGVLVSGLIMSLVIVFFVWIAATFIASNSGFDWGWFWITQFVEFAFLLFAAGVGVLFGSFMNASRAAGGVAVGIIALGYLLNIFGGLSDQYSWLLRLSPFYYAQATNVLINHQLTWWYPIILVIIGLACGVVGLFIFNKRDLPTV